MTKPHGVIVAAELPMRKDLDDATTCSPEILYAAEAMTHRIEPNAPSWIVVTGRKNSSMARSIFITVEFDKDNR